ncbi:MAG: hypothetical protein RL095_1874 [Verrucomicrobiota bacterium]|jgi:hypothetical protein
MFTKAEDLSQLHAVMSLLSGVMLKFRRQTSKGIEFTLKGFESRPVKDLILLRLEDVGDLEYEIIDGNYDEDAEGKAPHDWAGVFEYPIECIKVEQAGECLHLELSDASGNYELDFNLCRWILRRGRAVLLDRSGKELDLRRFRTEFNGCRRIGGEARRRLPLCYPGLLDVIEPEMSDSDYFFEHRAFTSESPAQIEAWGRQLAAADPEIECLWNESGDLEICIKEGCGRQEAGLVVFAVQDRAGMEAALQQMSGYTLLACSDSAFPSLPDVERGGSLVLWWAKPARQS